MSKATLCLWYNHDAEEASASYAATFPDTRIGGIMRAPSTIPRRPRMPCWWSR